MPIARIAVVTAALVVVAVVSFVLALGGAPQRVLVESAIREMPAPEQTTTPDKVTPAVPLSVLSDSHAYFAESWWRQTVVANAVEGASTGATASQPGAVADTIASGLDEAAAAAPNGYVLVQAGTNDLLAGSSPARASADIQSLWQGVRDRGSTPIAVLVPPSSEVGAEVIELNRLLAGAARAEGIAILDVYTPVAEADGGWQAGTSDDGKHANLEGASLQANDVLAQLPGILAGRLGQLSPVP